MTKEKFSSNRANNNLVVGSILIGLGVMFLLGELFDISLGRYAWPLFIILPGVFMLGLGINQPDEGGGLTIAGTLITTTGFLLLYQNSFDHWQSWAYAWALVAPTSVGLAQTFYGSRHKAHAHLIQDGQRLLKIGLALFTVGFIFFELIIGISGFGLGSLGWPVLLIIVGAFLLLRNLRK